MTDQFLRRASLTVFAGDKGKDLSELRFSFQVRQNDVETPNTAIIRVYNASASTVSELLGLDKGASAQYQRVILQAGYQGDAQYGVIFDGTIKQFRRGRERNVDSYLDILAADGDLGYNFGAVSQTLEAGAKPIDVFQASAKAMNVAVDGAISSRGLIGGVVLARGKVMYGLARAFMRDQAATQQGRWFLDKGTMRFVPLSTYLDGEAVVLNSQTGMIGVPEATDDGVHVSCLLNPNITVGRRVQINNSDINATFVQQQGFPQFSALTFPASVTEDGIYRVLVAEHDGDTRGQQWYSKLTCLAVDRTAKPINSVKDFGTLPAGLK